MKQYLSIPRISIQTKIILPYLILVFLLLAAIGYIGTQIISDSLEERFTNQLIEAGKLVNNGMVRQENLMLEVLRLLANTQGVAEAVQQNDRETLRVLSLPVAVNAREDVVLFLDLNGVSVLSMMHISGSRAEDYRYTAGDTEMQRWEIVKSVLDQKRDIQGDKFAAFESTSFGDYFFISSPIRDVEGNLAGVVLVGKSTKNIVDTLREETLAQVTLYGLDGQVIATTFIEPSTLDQSTPVEIISKQAHYSLTRDLHRSDITYTEILGAWKARGSDLGVVGTSFAQNFFIQFSEQRWRLLLISTISALFLVVAVGIFISKNIGGPILRLGHAAVQVSKGDLTIQVMHDGQDEISELTREFNSMVQNLNQSQLDLVAAYDNTIEAWARTLEMYDSETLGHSERVTRLTVELAASMGVSEKDLIQIQRGALLHDIGKLTIPVSILRKPGALTESEQALMRNHPTTAYEMLKGISFLSKALDIPYCHHENWDGSGYPRGLKKKEEIPLFARLFSVVDVWDALLSDRPYRSAMSVAEASKILMDGSEKQFDPNAVKALLKIMQAKQS